MPVASESPDTFFRSRGACGRTHRATEQRDGWGTGNQLDCGLSDGGVVGVLAGGGVPADGGVVGGLAGSGVPAGGVVGLAAGAEGVPAGGVAGAPGVPGAGGWGIMRIG